MNNFKRTLWRAKQEPLVKTHERNEVRFFSVVFLRNVTFKIALNNTDAYKIIIITFSKSNQQRTGLVRRLLIGNSSLSECLDIGGEFGIIK